ncbi:MAG: TldD/PmbA family protein [Solirubrobacteraceae bacterium]
MLDLLVEVVGALPHDCDYADARWVERAEDRVRVSGGGVDGVRSEREEGIGVRVSVGGAFAFAGTSDCSAAGARAALARALEVARALPRARLTPLTPAPAATGHWAGACEIDPFAQPLARRVEDLLTAEAELRGDPRIVRSEAEATTIRTRRALASSGGTACTQELHECGGGVAAHASDGEQLQVRSWPAGHGGQVAAGGYELLTALDLAHHAPRVAAEALELLGAPDCPAGRMTLVLGSEQLALQIHESIGHALELDRILLGEASYAGTSWVKPADIGTLRYGSEALFITADATLPGALGSFGWDDEGVLAQRLELIGGGVLRAAMSDRRSAAQIGGVSSGCARADSFARQPIVRMTNVSIEPGGGGSLDELVDGVKHGVLMETNRSWSIDDRRLDFRFGTEFGREIRDGRLGRLLRNPSYTGRTPSFWRSLHSVCGRQEWRLWGLLNCGKGEPGQVAHVSHGAAPARFDDVEVGPAR